MSQKEIKNIKFYLVFAICMLLLIIGFISLEIRVQKRWDNYEQKVFIERHINDISK